RKLNYAIALTKIDSPDANKAIIDAVRADPANMTVATAYASQLINNNRASEAVSLLEGVDAGNSTDPTVAGYYAQALARVGTSDSVDKAAAVVGKMSGLAEVKVTMAVGTSALNLKKYDVAVKMLTGNDLPEAQNNLGRAYEGLGQLDKAAEAYASASDKEPTKQLFAKNAAVTYAKLGNTEKARKYSERSGEVVSTQFDLSLIQGLVNESKYDEALVKMDQVEGQFTNSAEFYFNKGVIYQKKGVYDKAVAAYRKSKALKEEPATMKNLTIALYQANDLSAARLEAESYIGRVGRTSEALQNLGAILAAQGNNTEAINVWREALKLEDKPEVRLDLADAMWNSGDTQGARFHYAAVLKSDANSARAQNGMGLYMLAQSKLKDAEGYFRGAAKSDPKFYPALYNLAISLERQNKIAEAKSALNEALAIRPDYPEAKKALDRLNSQK
ncbi:MAG: tetratricopeptide repeat protein, partial [Armatimonadota bacterium]